MFFDKLNIEPDIYPQYKKMLKDENPILLWGCGELALHAYHYCKAHGIKPAGCFVNVEVSNTIFDDLHILSLEDAIGQYSKFSVLIGHSDYAGGVAYLKKNKQIKNIYCLSACNYSIWNLISSDFIRSNENLLDCFYSDLQDVVSKRCLKTYFESRINDKAEYMFSCFKQGNNYYLNDVISLTKNEVLLDVGACVGNAIWPFLHATKGKYKNIIALEPDEENYHALLQNIKNRGIHDVMTRKVCAYCENGDVKFSGNKESGGINQAAENYQTYPAIAIDSLCEELGPDSIPTIVKINFPFSVSEILYGAQSLIKSNRPKLIIRAGFDENVLLKTYETLKEINSMYQLYLRYTIGIPQGLTIFAI